MPTNSKTKATVKRLEAAVVAFHARYSAADQYGTQRWQHDLVPALLQPTSHAALVNGFVDINMVLQLFDQAGIGKHELSRLDISISEPGSLTPVCFERNTTETLHQPFPVPSRLVAPLSDQQRLLSHWNMDASSILAASLVNAKPGDRILDLCSAPGGKSIVLAQSLFPHLCPSVVVPETSAQLSLDEIPQSSLHCNEIDSQRNKRLEANLQAYLPADLFSSKKVRVLQLDGSSKTAVVSLPYGPAGYDKVLIDAPCSSERHILHAHSRATQSGQIADEMVNWKPSHSLTLAKTQSSLLLNGLQAVRTGGRVVYATCALGKEENDLVIEAVLGTIKRERKREKSSGKGNQWNWTLEVIMGEEGTGTDVRSPLLDEKTESTKYGRIALPDRGGWGPLYFCVMHKVERRKKSQTAKADRGASTAEGIVPETSSIEQDNQIK